MPNNNYFKIGVFTFAGLALFLAGLFFFGLSGSLFKEQVECVTFFDRSVQGLSMDSSVKFRGFNVGRVTGISLASVKDASAQPVVQVNFEIDPKNLAGQEEAMAEAKDFIVTQTDRGMKVYLSFQGITGLSFLDLDYVTDEVKPKDERQESIRQAIAARGKVYIPSGPGQIMEISESATRIVKSLSDVDFAGISRDIKTLVQTVDGAVSDLDTNRLSYDLSETLVEIRDAAGHLSTLSRDLKETIKGGSNSNLGREIEASVTQLRQTLRRFDQLLNSSQGNMPATLDNLRVMSENLRELSELLKDQPSQAIFGQPPRPVRPTTTLRER